MLLDRNGNPINNSKSVSRETLSRAITKFVNSGYSNAGASLDKPIFKLWNWSGGSPDDDIVENLPTLWQRSRQLAVEAPLVSGMFELLTTHTVGEGLKVEPTPDADYLGWSPEDVRRWKSKSLPHWEYYAESINCDVRQHDNFYELTQLACRSMDESGDILVTLPRFHRLHTPTDMKIQLIEADCCAEPQGAEALEHRRMGNDLFGGVEITEYGNVVGYWFFVGHPLARRRVAGRYGSQRERWIFIPAIAAETGIPNVLHLMTMKRPGQRRGIPLIAPLLELMLILDSYVKSEAIAAKIQAMFTLVVKAQRPADLLGEFLDMSDDLGQTLTETMRQSIGKSDIMLGNGIVQYLNPDEDVVPVNPSRPSNAFAEFMRFVIQMMGATTGIPYELLMMNFVASYSASRASMNMANTNFKIRRARIENRFCQPIYEQWMDEAVAKGWIECPGYFDNPITRRAYTRAAWNGPGMPEIDREKSINAAVAGINDGLITRSEAVSELTGGDFYENVAALGREREAMKAAGILPAEQTAAPMARDPALVNEILQELQALSGGRINAKQ